MKGTELNYINEKIIKKCLIDVNIPSVQCDGIIDMMKLLQPEIDIVEPVRCTDCIYYRDMDNCAMAYRCTDCGSDYMWNNSNDYCSMGERKEMGEIQYE